MAKKISSTERELKNEFFSNNKIADGGLRKLGIYKNSVLDKPLLTIIIAVFNGEKYLEETILSVLNQTYDNVEFIIIDGGSTDGSLGIIRKYEHAIDYWISEEDAGISDAFNKGVRLASGDYINFQGDGDGFYDSSSLAKIVVDINVEEDMFISARIQRVSEAGDELYISSFSPQFNKKSLLFRMSMPHQGLFTNVEYFKKYGLFDVDNTYCMDYEHLLRAYHDFPSVIMKNVVVAKWRADGLGNDRDLDIFKEYHKIKVDNKVASLTVLRCINFWTLFKYIIKKAIK
ncbi:glycosyltransferase [Aliivibrio fischeri]|nr:glycosyltransferase [Aliivibrio fischeri]